MNKIFLASVLILSIPLTIIHAQTPNVAPQTPSTRIFPAPESVFKMFRDAGMDPINHELTTAERIKVESAFAILPPLHKKILSTHLHSISFMDNMPNTALTSPVKNPDSTTSYNITFRAGILNETISEWATKKENILFDRSQNPEIEISIEAGKLDAIIYILLHEATHVVDAVLELTPHTSKKDTLVNPTPFTTEVWQKMNTPVAKFIDSLVEKTIFRGGRRLPITSAPEVYTQLSKMPFPSLYATASWHEDIAEIETIYHLTHKLNQPFHVIVKKNNTLLIRFDPMKNKLVKKRLPQLERFYHA